MASGLEGAHVDPFTQLLRKGVSILTPYGGHWGGARAPEMLRLYIYIYIYSKYAKIYHYLYIYKYDVFKKEKYIELVCT